MLPSKLRRLQNLWQKMKRASRRLQRPARAQLALQHLEDRVMLTANDELFASTVYQDMLRRPADSQGQAFWTGLLKTGASRGDVALKMTFATDEFNSNQVQLAFQKLLQRPADTDGFNHYLTRMKAGLPIEQMQAEIIGSAEYFQKRATNNDANFVTAVYEDVFIRDVDAAGQSHFVTQTGLGVSRTEFARQLLGSHEYRQNLAENFYEQFLFRTGEKGGLDHWEAKLTAGESYQQVLAGFPGSPEYSAQIERRQPIAARAPMLVPGEVGQPTATSFTLKSTSENFSNELGLFLVDAQGRIGALEPGAPGYAAAALSSPVGQILFTAGTAAGAEKSVSLPAGSHFGFYLVQHKSTRRALLHNSPNELGAKPMVYFSLPQANPDLFDHVRLGANNEFAFEDLTGGGDQSFDDLVVQVSFADTGALGVSARLTHDTGTSATDGITMDAAIAGSISGTGTVATLRASFDSTAPANGLDVLADLQADRTFSFSAARLNAINGSSLADGAHVLHLQVGDSAGKLSPILDLSFTLDTQAPINQIQSPAAGATITTNVIVDGNVSDSLAGVDSVRGRVDGGEFATVLINEAGDFSFPLQLALDGSADGSHTVTLQTTDLAGNSAESGVSFILNTSTQIVLTEGTQFRATREQNFVIPAEPSVLTFTYSNLTFAAPLPNTIKDAFEVALVDADGKPLTHTIGAGLDAFLNITRDEQIVRAPGITQTDTTVTVNLAGIRAGTAARLIFRLLNNDGTTTTSVGLDNARIVANPDGQPTVASPLPAPPGNVGASFDFAALSDVSPVVRPQYGETAFDEDTNVLHVGIGVSNAGNYAIAKPLLVAVAHISDPSVRVRNADGVTPEGLPFYDASMLVPGDALLPGTGTGMRPIEFFNPNRVPFTYELVMLGQLNRAPALTSDPVVEASPEKAYKYTATASDPDEDILSFTLRAGPAAMTIDAATGQLSWTPGADDRGSRTVIVEVADGKGGTARQQFTLVVDAEAINRPPVFTSTPTIDAYVNTAYVYDARATDLDEDALKFSLTSGVHGMSIDDQTGTITWTPTDKLTRDGQIWDAAKDFSGNVNPSGPWSYGWTATQGGLFHTYPTSIVVGGGLDLWEEPAITSALAPSVYHNGTDHFLQGSGPFEPGDLGFHPGPNNERSVVRWTAPASGTYFIDAEFGNKDSAFGTSTNVHILQNSQAIFDGIILGTGHPKETFGGFVSLSAGDTIDFIVDFGDNGYSGDSTALIAKIAQQIEVGDTVPVGVQVEDGHGGVAVQAFDIRLHPEPGNRAPVIVSTPGASAFVGATYTYDLAALDPDGDVLTLAKSAGAVGAQVDVAGLRLIWTPGPGEVGQQTITLVVADGKGGLDNQEFVVNVLEPAEIHGEVFDIQPLSGEVIHVESIPGQADPWLAGMPDGSQASQGDVAPQQSPTLVPNLVLIAGDILTFSNAGGMAGYSPSRQFAPDGQADFLVPHRDDAQNGISSVVAPAGGLIGVFLSDDRPDLTPAPDSLDFSSPGNVLGGANYTKLAPMLKQVFFIGDGLTAMGSRQLINVPDGATRLFLGVMDGFGWFDNPGAFNIDVTVSKFNTAPERGTLYLDLNEDGQLGENEPTTKTAADNSFDFKNLAPATYTVRQLPRTGWTNTDPGTDSRIVTVATGQIASGIKFTNEADIPGSVHGTIFLDRDGDGSLNGQPVEQGLSGWTVYLDQNLDGKRNAGEAFTLTSIDGDYSFPALAPGNYTVRAEVPVGMKQTSPVSSQTFALTRGQDREGPNLGFTSTSERPPNTAPVFTSTPPTSSRVGNLYRYQVAANDADSDLLTFDLVVAPRGMVIHPTLGAIAWLPGEADRHPQSVIVRVRDGKGGVALQQFTLEIQEAAAPPAITSVPVAQSLIDLPYQYQVMAQSPRGLALRFSLPNSVGNMTIDPSTGLLAYTPTGTELGQHSIAVAATDSEGGFAIQHFLLRVVQSAANTAPEISSIPRPGIRLGSNYFYAVQASDPDGDPLTYQLDTFPAGMTMDARGVITWTPTGLQFGSHPVQIRAYDGRGGVAEQLFSIEVFTGGPNAAPTISSTPATGATAERTYSYDVRASDPDGDPIAFSLVQAPSGMSIDPLTGKIRWTPTLAQVGPHEIQVTVADAQGGSSTQNFTLKVRGSNLPPRILTNPITKAAADRDYEYAVRAIDGNGDPLTYALPTAPAGMVITPDGVIHWQPGAGDVGTQSVLVHIEDDQGGVVQQAYTLVVVAASPNAIPDITSTPLIEAVAGQPYSYQVVASDADGDPIQYSLLDQLAGMQIDSVTGLLTWLPTAADIGTGVVSVVAADPDGAQCIQSYTLRIRDVNTTPTIGSSPVTGVTAGSTYQYDVNVSDLDGDTIEFKLDAAPAGMTIDNLGRIRWATTASAVGTRHVKVTADDGHGGKVSQEFDLTVSADAAAPQVVLLVAANPVNLGDENIIQVKATDNVNVQSLKLTINGVATALDANGRAVVTMATAGGVDVVATATDAAGNTSTKTVTVLVVDPNVTDAPVVELTSPTDNVNITAPADVIGTVTDADLVSWKLELALFGGGQFITIATGTTVITNGKLGTVDPTLLQNDSYILRLTALNAGGLSSSTEMTINISGELKLGNFTLSFTDVSIPVSGIPITVTRTYNTLNASRDRELGFGWNLDFRNVDFRTSLMQSGNEPELYTPFKDGTRVYITLPGGQREGFTFRPKAVGLFDQFQRERDVGPDYQSGNGFNMSYFVPYFEPDKGVTDRLVVNRVQLSKQGHEYFTFGGLLPYNIAADEFGGRNVRLVTKDGLTFRINAGTGLVDSVTDTRGNAISFDENGITSSGGAQVTFDRDAQGRITSITDPVGGVVRYEYNANGDLVGVTDQGGSRTKFSYKSSPAHFLEQILDPLNRSLARTEYDGSGRLIGITGSNGAKSTADYDPATGIETIVDGRGERTIYQYDARGNTIATIDALGGVTSQTFDDDNNITSETDALGRVRLFTYDSAGNRLSETNPGGGVVRSTYDQNNRLLTSTDALGNTTTNSYDASGDRLTTTDPLGRTTRFTYDSSGRQLSATDSAGNILRKSYDSRGNVVNVTDALGRNTNVAVDGNGRTQATTTLVTLADGPHEVKFQYRYDAAGNRTGTIDPMGSETTDGYNAARQLTSTRDELGLGLDWVNDADGRSLSVQATGKAPTNLSYDANGNVVDTTDQAGRTTRSVYDALNRLIVTIFADDTPLVDTDNPRTQTEYDAIGRVKATIDQRGNRSEYFYDDVTLKETIRDALGNETSVQMDAMGRVVATMDGLGRTTQFELDALGRTIKTTYPDGTFTRSEFGGAPAAGETKRIDQLGRATQFEYDAVGRLTAVVDPAGRRTAYGYDELGHRTSITDANGRVTRYEYDLAGRNTAVVLPSGAKSQTSYDATGRVIQFTDFNGELSTTEYDAAGRRSALHFNDGKAQRYTYTADGAIDTVSDGMEVTDYDYDAQGRIIRRVDPDGHEIQYGYDATGNRTLLVTLAGTTSYGYDSLNRLSTVTAPNGNVTRYSYDQAGSLIQTELPNGLVEKRTYDLVNHLIEISTANGLNTLEELDYTYDAAGQTTGVLELRGRDVRFVYDEAGRLIREVAVDGILGSRTTEYAYDAVGNRLSKTDSSEGTTSYDYDADDRLLTEVMAGQTTTYTYDANGNALTRFTTAVDQVFSHYDAQNRLIAAEVTDASGTHNAVYRYNPDGVRTAAVIDGVETRYQIDTSGDYPQVSVEYTPGGLILASFVYGNALISQDQSGAISYRGVDAVGSTRLLSDEIGEVAARYVYDGFGKLLSFSGTASSEFLFAGERRDSVLGLDYLRARYYDPGLGRFISRDPATGAREVPLSLNKYIYANDGPLDRIDPTGRTGLLLYAAISTVALTGLSFYLRNSLHNDEAISGINEFLRDVKKIAGVGLSSDAANTRLYLGDKAALPEIRKVWSDTLAAVSSNKFLYVASGSGKNIGKTAWKYIDGTEYPDSRAYVRGTSIPFSPLTSNKFNEVSLGKGRFTQENLPELAGSILSGALFWVANNSHHSVLPLNYSSDTLELPRPRRTNLLVWNWVAIAEKAPAPG